MTDHKRELRALEERAYRLRYEAGHIVREAIEASKHIEEQGLGRYARLKVGAIVHGELELPHLRTMPLLGEEYFVEMAVSSVEVRDSRRRVHTQLTSALWAIVAEEEGE